LARAGAGAGAGARFGLGTGAAHRGSIHFIDALRPHQDTQVAHSSADLKGGQLKLRITKPVVFRVFARNNYPTCLVPCNMMPGVLC